MEDAIIGDKVMLRRFLDDMCVQYICEPEVRAADQEGRSFININTIEDYEMTIGHDKGFGAEPESRSFIF
jgi:molybdopterin-guanine dinucleotide biosynthesis protein A